MPDTQKHLIFVMIDHYEPGRGAPGAHRNDEWLKRYRLIADAHQDSYGNKFRYTWFYPYDHRNAHVLASLSRMTYDDYGEVELHWHHPTSTPEAFPQLLQEALTWFQQYGALVSSGPERKTHFAFVHGNWALDNSAPFCGVGNELNILFDHGCYADFTFPALNTVSQPHMVNAIYYATDTPDPKSYDTGIDVQVGRAIDDRLMIFTGPVGVYWMLLRTEYGAIGDLPPSASQIEVWIDANIHVRGRPEWVLVKAYTHGIQAKIVYTKDLALTLENLEGTCKKRGISLHYMSAREAFNVVKAAEDGKTGDPESYRDYRILKPLNMQVQMGE